MKKAAYLILFISINVFCQSTFNPNSFAVSLGDLSTKSYANDSTANALVIYEKGNSFYHKDLFELVFQYQKKIKIFNKQDDENTTIEIYLYQARNKKESIKNINAKTHNLENGRIVTTKLDKSEVYEEKFNDNYTIVKFTMPNVKDGSVITYSYETHSPYMYKYQPWYFQESIPKLYSEYNTSIPANFEYNIKLVGDLKLITNTTETERNCLEGSKGAYADCLNSKYVIKNIPAFVDEDYMTTRENYLSRIEYELGVFKSFDGTIDKITMSWKDVDKELNDNINIGRQLNKTGVVKKILDNNINLSNNKLDNAKEIFEFVQKNYTWNKDYQIFKNISVKDLLNEKTGNVSEINILLHNLLKEAKIDVKPILLSTRKNGLPTKIYPVISDFNYLIVQASIDGENYFLDATSKHLAFGQLPFKCLNQYGRSLDFKNGSTWVDIKPTKFSFTQYRIESNLSSEGTISGTVQLKTSGYHALNKKMKYFSSSENYINDLTDKFPDIEISNYKLVSGDINTFSFEEEFKILLSELIGSDKIFINPFIFKFFKENPFKLQERTYPIDFGYKDIFSYSFKLNIAQNYEIVELPKNILAKLPNNSGSLAFNTTKQGNSVILTIRVKFNKEIYEAAYYEYLKEFMNKIINVQNNSFIILKRI